MVPRTMEGRLHTLRELAFAVLVLAFLVPLWAVRYPPFVDFPQYVAAAAVLADYAAPRLRYGHYFTRNFDTYSLLAPWLAALFAKLFDPLIAAKLIVSAIIVGTPYAVRSLLKALRQPAEYALFVLPLAYNAHVMLGFVNYALGVLFMLWGLALGALRLADDRRARQVGLAFASLACLYCHVLPFAFLQLGLGLLVVAGAARRRWLQLVLPLAPALGLGLIGFTRSSSGWQTLPVGLAAEVRDCPIYDPTNVVFAQIPEWLNDVYSAQWDERLLLGLFLLGMLLVIAGPLWQAEPTELWRRRARAALAALAPLGLALYFAMPRTCDWIYPIHARFLFIGVMLAVLVLPALPERPLLVLALVLALVSVSVVGRTTREFVRFNAEVGDFDAALAVIPQGSLVANLSVETGSSRIKLNAFQHFALYNQVKHGGLTMFNFATMHHWPLAIRPGLGLPELGWTFQFDPQALKPSELTWPDYILSRVAAPSAVQSGFTRVYGGERWQVFERKRSAR